MPIPERPAAREPYSIKCGRCGLIFPTYDCGKLEHFGIYRVVCPHCAWPGRYLASELHAAPRRGTLRNRKIRTAA